MRRPALLISSAAILLFLLLALLGGGGHALDVAVIRHFQTWRVSDSEATSAVILLTHAGGAPFLLTIAAIGSALLWWSGRVRRAVALAATVIGGRLGLELIKLIVDRPRPSFDAHPIEVFSQSFPSGHAGNSMTTYLALAVFAAPEHWRRPAVAAALVAALAIGATRPVLGVHWPSDVVGGWIYGLVVVTMAWKLSRRQRSGA
jgi:undecaprenyl-diphosphatase